MYKNQAYSANRAPSLRAKRQLSAPLRATTKSSSSDIGSRRGDADVTYQMTATQIGRIEPLILLNNSMIGVDEAGLLLGLSKSQVYKLLASYRSGGVAQIQPQRRNIPSNRAFSIGIKNAALDLIRTLYRDFGPTLISEKLRDKHHLFISRETIRRWMIENKLWSCDRRERKKLHQPRKRMAGYGALIQVDGSDHDWFEGRGERCTLMVYIDDATSQVQKLTFFPREDRAAYVISTCDYLKEHGRPLRIQTDRHGSIYSPSSPSEYSSALKALGIVHSVAYSPQSKGRVERLHRTLQDRLVKDLRCEDISTIEAANAYLPQFVERYNRQFSKSPALPDNLHRPIHDSHDIHYLFAKRFERKVSLQGTFSMNGKLYAISPAENTQRLIGKRISIAQNIYGEYSAYFEDKKINFKDA